MRIRRGDILPYVAVAVAWAVAVLLTHPVTTGDTGDYIASITARMNGRDYNYWDFGHLLWRPLGTFFTSVMQALTGSADVRLIALTPLVATNVAAGLGIGLFLLATFRLFEIASRRAVPLTIALLLTQGVLNYAQSGTAYVPGLFFLTLGLYLAVRSALAAEWRTNAVLAGVAGALAAAFWLPYVFVVPALGAAAALLGPKRRVGALIAVAAGAGITAFTVFVGTAIAIGVRTPAEFWTVFTAASHGISGISGIPRAVLGFGRSFLYVGDDGAVMRRYVTGDPYAPVGLPRVLATRIWLIALIWLVGGLVLLRLAALRRWHSLLFVFLSAAAPIMLWAIAWQGGDIERYMPLYPFLFLLLAAVFSATGSRRTRLAVALGLAFMAVNNVAGLSVFAAEARRDAVAHRLEPLRGRAASEDLIWVSHIQDDVLRLSNAFPLQPLLEGLDLRAGYLIQFGAPQVDYWQQAFAERVQRVWEQGSDVWISTRLLAPTPDVHWNWIEGSDARISWPDFQRFFRNFDLESAEGDTFLRLLRTRTNEALIAQLASGASRPG